MGSPLVTLGLVLLLAATMLTIGTEDGERTLQAHPQGQIFVLRLEAGTEVTARAVIDACGTWKTPNVLSANGLLAPGELDATAWIDHALPDILGSERHRYAGRHTVVVGAGHSAATTLLALSELVEQEPGTRTTIRSWAL
ncbi:hypothetical protein [Nonomuraea dietziae]|uniref:hypothetical protein n=1 Tax=Nonomuraea dietziae TaxID=65515 RepID=UPI0033E1DC33